MPYPAIAVANAFLARAKLDDKTLTPMQIQKLVYFSHGWHLALTNGQPLVDEPAQAWAWGPVFPTLYHAAKEWGGDPIERLITVPERTFRGGTPSNQLSIPTVPPWDSYVSGLLDRIWDTYGHLGGARLSQLSHDPEGPWFNLRQETQAQRGVDIPDARILAYFTEQMNANTPS